ncbi:MAG: chemotaxis protein CheD [Thermoleophilia bacterium]|jgi:chemotaxis protein CheD|nr:chemotaxis protein CheD [Thermoleophilia bacterium]
MTPTLAPPGAARRSSGPAASIKVGLGQLAVTRDPGDVLAAIGLGSCIGLAAVDLRAGVAGMAHVMLPESAIAKEVVQPGKFADTAVPALVEAMVRLGAEPGRLVVKMAGGAQMFQGQGGVLNIGMRNAIAVRAALKSAGLRLRAADTGGTVGRTLDLVVATGRMTVRAIGQELQEL